MSPTNPYNYNLPVEPEMFFGRQGDVNAIVQGLIMGQGDSFALVGGRRIGKTSLLEEIFRRLRSIGENPAQHLFPLPILIDLSGEGIDSDSTFFRMALERIQSTYVDLSISELKDCGGNESRLAAPAFARTLEEWGRVVTKERQCRLRLILLLDECEEIVEKPWTASLYKALRYLLVGQATRNLIKVVLAGSRRFLTGVSQSGSPLRNVLDYHKMTVLDQEATSKLIAQPTGGRIKKELAHAVAKQSGGHPFLTQYIMHHLWEHELENIGPTTIEKITNAFHQERSDFWDWKNSIGNSGLIAYGMLSRLDRLTEKEFQNSLPLSRIELRQALDALSYHGLVVCEKSTEGNKASGQMFRDWFEVNFADLVADKSITHRHGSKTKDFTPEFELFLAYSHNDEKLRNELVKQLSMLKRLHLITEWYDGKIVAGQEWDEKIKLHLSTANVILLLISSDFLASDYGYRIEMARAMERQTLGEACVIPVLLRAVDYKGAPFGKLEILPKNGLPITSWTNPDEAFHNVAKGIREAIEELAGLR